MRLDIKRLTFFFFLFSLLNFFLYLFIILFHAKIRFDKYDYINNAHHFVNNFQSSAKSNFNLTSSLAVYDSQWYLKIATKSYPKNPKVTNLNNKRAMDGLTYAFFPLYPIILHLVNILVKNLQIAGFLLANTLMVLNFFSLYFLVSKIYSPNIALKSIFLLFLFPFGIFYRSYFSEGLYLLLLIWFAYFLLKKRYIVSSLLLGFLDIAHGSGILINIYFLYRIYKAYREGCLSSGKGLASLFILVAPFLAWMYFCFIQTNNFLYFLSAASKWLPFGYLPFWLRIFLGPIYSLATIIAFPFLPLHSFHYSQVDVFFVLLGLLLLVKSKKYLKAPLWWISFCLWLTPLIVKDLMSFSRLQSVSFPLFIYAAYVLRGKWYGLMLLVFLFGLFAVALFFVDWHWIG